MGWIRPALTAFGVATVLTVAGCGGSAGSQEVAATNEDGASSADSAQGADREADQDASKNTDYPTQTMPACDVLTRGIAKSVLGSVGEASAPPPANTSDDVSLSSCVRTNTAASAGTPRSVSLLMRVARNVTGAMGNESVFASASLPSGAQPVSGYGEAAFWNPAFGQLNILENGNWYILASGPIDPRKHTLAETKTLADAIIDKL